ncbi:UV-damage endonuclease [Zalerion maritima]|uniref:UV-damage endonuclease n=1 Tax=Zalerion maritima TaxID=339359 RepID=A0AAD5WPZ1_9PEZI|nr:UV-damage endonuclease [Zalerion maritima]
MPPQRKETSPGAKKAQSEPMPDVLAPNPRHIGKAGNGVRLLIPGSTTPSSRRSLSSAAEKDLRSQTEESQSGVERAVEELAEMEKRFKDTVRRQRLAVLQSQVGNVSGADLAKKGDLTRKRSTDVLRTVANERARKRARGKASKKQTAKAEDEETEKARGKGKKKASPVIKVEDVDAAEDGDGEYVGSPRRSAVGAKSAKQESRKDNNTEDEISGQSEDHQHPLQDQSRPEHATKNRPDKSKPKDAELGAQYVKSLGLKNAEDLAKLIRWNEEFGIRFLRISSEMFPFASHETYGYSLDFAGHVLREAGRLVARWGHRISAHPGQYTQIASPRDEVVTASIRDLEYHDQMLSLLDLPGQQDKDAVMIIHMGGTHGDKTATLTRFRHNYTTRLSEGVKRRLVLENDDVSWSLHDLLPVCEDLDIPLVFDWHHHNIVYDGKELRPGSKDVCSLLPRILNTWKSKGITPKMHYSEPTKGAATRTAIRKHSPRVERLPPCPEDMDLMIEAKDKEQAVFELMRRYKLEGWGKVGDIENEGGRAVEKSDIVGDDGKETVSEVRGKANGTRTRRVDKTDGGEAEKHVDEGATKNKAKGDVLDVGGKDRRVYWPLGQEGWLKVKKDKGRGKKER